MRWFHSQNKITLCPSQEAEILLNKHGIHNTGIFSRGIDFENFHPKYRSIKLRESLNIDNKLTFLYVGRVSIEKDLDILSESYKAIHEKYGDKVALIITGDGPYLEKCKDNFPGNTIFTGFKRGQNLSEIYASCDAFVCPSSTETFGNVILEAMASGLPVIGADAGGIGEIINQRYNGLKFKKRDSKELTACMMEIIENTTLRANLIIDGRNYALNRSWGKIFNGLMSIYNDILNERKNITISA
jgi:glycosyltransferase involved in cell wall biosynthesis